MFLEWSWSKSVSWFACWLLFLNLFDISYGMNVDSTKLSTGCEFLFSASFNFNRVSVINTFSTLAVANVKHIAIHFFSLVANFSVCLAKWCHKNNLYCTQIPYIILFHINNCCAIETFRHIKIQETLFFSSIVLSVFN